MYKVLKKMFFRKKRKEYEDILELGKDNIMLSESVKKEARETLIKTDKKLREMGSR